MLLSSVDALKISVEPDLYRCCRSLNSFGGFRLMGFIFGCDDFKISLGRFSSHGLDR